ncbi:MAG: 30S ribosomal protein S12 methylthiotransferase RimO [Desulfobacterales bacterium]|nr:30S ribosomal protein S12 methylthiotransferase RimO [Desulfobacterales bacterium]
MKKLHLTSLGCARNQVNSEIMLGSVGAKVELTDDPSVADIIVVNTCSFIRASIDESIDTILALSEYKKEGACKKLIVAGCLPERYQEEIKSALPEVDNFLGTGAYDKLGEAIDSEGEQECLLPDPNLVGFSNVPEKRERENINIAYVKVAEGCDRKCTYCIIPSLRGKQRSKPAEFIISEIDSLVKEGTKEILLVAENTTDYGADSGSNINTLVKKISNEIAHGTWVKLLYGHPLTVSDELLTTIESDKNINSYLDIPVQHASTNVLKRMGRDYSNEVLVDLYKRIKDKAPSATLRTTIIVGFPGETEKDFETLLKFVSDVKFDNLGVFTYSDSEDLPSHKLTDHVAEEVAQDRYDKLMALQQKISLENNRKRVDKTYSVLIEENPEEGVYLGRCEFQAPEVDGVTFVYGKNLDVGTFVDIIITDTYEYDLAGEPT